MKTYHSLTGKRFRFSLFFLLLFLFGCRPTAEPPAEWQFQTDGRNRSQPVVYDGSLYFGSGDGHFYSVDAVTGRLTWKFKTDHPVRSRAVVSDSAVYFTSGNNLYALNRISGTTFWSFIHPDTSGTASLDPWDYVTGSPVLYKNAVFAGFGEGSLIGFRLSSGEAVFRFKGMDKAPIRSTPVIEDSVLYFGDWNGVVYAVSLMSGDTIWTRKTYEEQPYPTFGQINTALAIKDSLLFFGARNPELTVLNKYSGEKAWSWVSEDGGWISGDPVIRGDTLFIGGSDNHLLLAFETSTGTLIWNYPFLFNSFSPPLVLENRILFTTGDAYAFTGSYSGHGYLYALKKENGKLIRMRYFPANLFNAPVVSENRMFISGDNGIVQAIDKEEFLQAGTDYPWEGHGPVDSLTVFYDSLPASLRFTFRMKESDSIRVMVRAFDGTLVKNLFEGISGPGRHQYAWNGLDHNNKEVPQGYYFFEITSGMFVKNHIARIRRE